MVNLSAAMGARFAEIATEMDAHIRKLGPNPLGRSLSKILSRGEKKDTVGGEE